jgi:hypothetical protein
VDWPKFSRYFACLSFARTRMTSWWHGGNEKGKMKKEKGERSPVAE